MTKQYTLDEIFTYCESMWIWIADQIETGRGTGVITLKKQWLKTHGFTGIIDDCFFCHYAYHANGDTYHGDMCIRHCPGKRVDPGFDCFSYEYHYYNRPIEFKDRIVEMNKPEIRSNA